MMRCKAIMANLLTVVGLIVEPITDIEKPTGYIEGYISIRQPPWKVTYSKPVISLSLSILFYFCSMLISNSRSHQSISY